MLMRWFDFVAKYERKLGRFGPLAKALLVFLVQRRFCTRVRALRKVVCARKLRVVFVVGDVTKWKAQTLYDKMLTGDLFDPYVAPTVMDKDWIPFVEQKGRVETLRNYFAKKKVQMVDVFDLETMTPIPLKEINPDIVIYLQPWGIYSCQHPVTVSKYAITCYLPYCIFSYGDSYEMFFMEFIKQVHIYFIEHKQWADYFMARASKWRQGSRLIPTGNPYCELVIQGGELCVEDGSVIYAPHWSLDSSGYCGTFDRTGKLVLEIARNHPEIKWVFKPHPMLKYKVVEYGVMTHEEVAQYYKDWESIGVGCYDSDYFPLFHRSSILITDCQTFLTEYLLTGKPIIRLVPSVEVEMLPPAKRLFDAFYNVRTKEELESIFKRVVCEKEDELCNVRKQVRHDLGYDDVSASKKIIGAFCDILKGKC